MTPPTLPTKRILELAADRSFLRAMDDLYACLDRRVSERTPVCVNRGDCCRFGEFGHRLYVTPAELAYFVANVEEPILVDGSILATEPLDRCPYQQAGKCSARIGRPMGCRIFFCETRSQGWQPGETESTLAEIKALHERFTIPYAYLEWLDSLAQLRIGQLNGSRGL
jgi:Fe-S-cluster containining protein